MEQDSFKMFSFLLKIILLLQLAYSINHQFGAEATQSEVYERLSKVEAHNRQQEKEISLLKTQAIGDRKEIHLLRDRVAHLEAASTLPNLSSDAILGRPIRPVRLLPARLFMNSKDTKDEAEGDPKVNEFYGPPTSCEELSKLGYTLNGYYLVKGQNNLDSFRIRAVYCQFKKPQSTKHQGKGLLETRIGIVDVKSSLVQFNVLTEGGYNRVNAGQRIRYEKQTVNVGNGFDWNSQIFRAPYPGTYFFSVSGTKNFAVPNSTRAAVNILVNGEGIGEAVSSEKPDFGGFSCQVITQLNASDKVELFMKFGRVFNVYFTGWMLDENLTI